MRGVSRIKESDSSLLMVDFLYLVINVLPIMQWMGGNWLWGHAMSRLGFDYSSAQIGSQSNESFKDSKGDQKAIRSGFHHKVSTTKNKPFVLKNAY
jgi:hypothetical protein